MKCAKITVCHDADFGETADVFMEMKVPVAAVEIVRQHAAYQKTPAESLVIEEIDIADRSELEDEFANDDAWETQIKNFGEMLDANW